MQHGLNEPEGCDRCACPRFIIERQWKTKGFIQAVWICAHCHARNRTQTPNGFIKAVLAEEAANGTKRRRASTEKKRHWWGDD